MENELYKLWEEADQFRNDCKDLIMTCEDILNRLSQLKANATQTIEKIEGVINELNQFESESDQAKAEAIDLKDKAIGLKVEIEELLGRDSDLEQKINNAHQNLNLFNAMVGNHYDPDNEFDDGFVV